MSAGTFTGLSGDHIPVEPWQETTADAAEPLFAPRHGVPVDRSRGDRLVMAILSLAAFALVATNF